MASLSSSCSVCRAQVGSDARYCPACGEMLRVESSSEDRHHTDIEPVPSEARIASGNQFIWDYVLLGCAGLIIAGSFGTWVQLVLVSVAGTDSVFLDGRFGVGLNDGVIGIVGGVFAAIAALARLANHASRRTTHRIMLLLFSLVALASGYVWIQVNRITADLAADMESMSALVEGYRVGVGWGLVVTTLAAAAGVLILVAGPVSRFLEQMPVHDAPAEPQQRVRTNPSRPAPVRNMRSLALSLVSLVLVVAAIGIYASRSNADSETEPSSSTEPQALPDPSATTRHISTALKSAAMTANSGWQYEQIADVRISGQTVLVEVVENDEPRVREQALVICNATVDSVRSRPDTTVDIASIFVTGDRHDLGLLASWRTSDSGCRHP